MTHDPLDDPTSGIRPFTASMMIGLAAGAIGDPVHRRAV